MRAAEYVRVSTDLQQYSITSQQATIAEYAAKHGFELVRTYSDPAKSGLDIKHRPGLQSLIDDVIGGRADFQAVLVYDVSRWGRFQDCDEAACYEFLCKRAGIRVHYCAEPFQNDGSPYSSFLKMVKRAMAAEYPRELSVKVLAGQCRIAAEGYRIGGHGLYGLRRALVRADGKSKTILRDGEWKSLTTDRVTYVLGPEHEVSLIRRIYSMFLDDELGIGEIGNTLNKLGLHRGGRYGPWIYSEVVRVLTHPAYVGCAVFNRTSRKLKSKHVRNPRKAWVIKPDAFPAIVNRDRFERAQAKLANFVHRRSDDQLLAELKAYVDAGGKGLPWSKRPAGMAGPTTYRKRFGGAMAAYAAIGYRGSAFTSHSFEQRRNLVAIKFGVMNQLKAAFADAGQESTHAYMKLRVARVGEIALVVGQQYLTPRGQQTRWRVKTDAISLHSEVVVARLESGNTSVQDFVLLRETPRAQSCLILNDATIREKGALYNNAAGVVSALLERI